MQPVLPRWSLFVGIFGFLLLCAWGLQLAWAQESPPSQEAAAELLSERLSDIPEPLHRIGTETCLGCHADRLAELEQTHPAFLEYGESGMFRNHSCETCHGPGSNHVVGGGNAEGILHPLKLTAEESNSVCLECHAGADFALESEWHESHHAGADLACVTCHDPHRETPHLLRPLDIGRNIGADADAVPIQDPLQLGPPFAGLDSVILERRFVDPKREFASTERFCTSCHASAAVDFTLRSHHPIEQTSFSCTTCHNPHKRSVNHADLIRETNGLCESCHIDYAGPFAFDHAPVHDTLVGDGCITCHNPHGSSHDHLLKIDNRGLCLQCHVEQDTIGPEPHFAGTCWASGCHQQVHGSHTSVLFLDRQPGIGR